MTISRSQMYRQLYQMGGPGIMQLGNGQEQPIFPRLETLSQNLGQAEQTLGQPTNQFNTSSITTAITGQPQGFANGGIGSLANRQGYFLGGLGDIVGDVFGGIGDVAGSVVGGIGDVVGNIGGAIGDVVSSDIFKKALPLAIAYFTGNPAAATASEGSSFLPSFLQAGGTEGGIGSFLGNIGSFMPQGETSGFNPYQFASNLLEFNHPDDNKSNEPQPMDTVSIITNILNKLLTKEGIAGTTGTTVAKLTYDEIKALNDFLKQKYAAYETGKEAKRTQYRTPESRAQLPGYRFTGIPSTVSDVYRAPAMRGGIMNIPMGDIRNNSAGVRELDYRKKGGYVPPVGIKEKADDIPAMLSNNEFVFTANAVRGAGKGDVKKGAKRMYALMKQLEGGR